MSLVHLYICGSIQYGYRKCGTIQYSDENVFHGENPVNLYFKVICYATIIQKKNSCLFDEVYLKIYQQTTILIFKLVFK